MGMLHCNKIRKLNKCMIKERDFSARIKSEKNYPVVSKNENNGHYISKEHEEFDIFLCVNESYRRSKKN